MELLWSLAVATSGNRWQWDRAKIRRITRKPLPWVATGCRSERMVRRGSTVRVRQRASTQALQMGLWCCLFWRVMRARVRDGYTFPGLAGIRGKRDVGCRLATHLVGELKLRARGNLPAYGDTPLPCWASPLTPSCRKGVSMCFDVGWWGDSRGVRLRRPAW
jgi:hypothetical protein